MFVSTKKVSELIAEIDEQISNAYSSATKVSWINEVEQGLYGEAIDDYADHEFTITTAATEVPIALTYADGPLTVSFLFEDIKKVQVKHSSWQYDEYSPTTLLYIPSYSYYKTGEKLGYSDPKDGDKVLVKYRRLPAMKLVANITTDYLSLPDRHLKLYKYYIFSEILKLKREYAESNNWATLYNAAIEDFRNWYYENKATYGG